MLKKACNFTYISFPLLLILFFKKTSAVLSILLDFTVTLCFNILLFTFFISFFIRILVIWIPVISSLYFYFFYLLDFGPHPVKLRGYLWLCAQELLLVEGPYGTTGDWTEVHSASAECKVNACHCAITPDSQSSLYF